MREDRKGFMSFTYIIVAGLIALVVILVLLQVLGGGIGRISNLLVSNL